VEGKSLLADLLGKTKSFDDFVEDADYAVIEDAYRRASRILSPDLSRTYAEYLAAKGDPDSPEESLMNAHTDIAALGLVPDVKEYLDAEAEKLAKAWLNEYRVAIKGLSDERQEAYRQIREMSTEPQDIDLTKPKSWMEPTVAREANGDEHPLPTRKHHLLCDTAGNFPADLNSSWEKDVLDREMNRAGFVAWYRNPSSASQESLAVAYDDGNIIKMVRPDFIFFSERADGTTGAVIVDPHGFHLGDALPKLRGLANYAEKHSSEYQRIESVAKIGDKLRVLDLTSHAVRIAIADAVDAKRLYEGAHASDY